jgi:hypothetical protein
MNRASTFTRMQNVLALFVRAALSFEWLTVRSVSRASLTLLRTAKVRRACCFLVSEYLSDKLLSCL